MTAIPLTRARFCPDDEIITDAPRCPRCDSEGLVLLVHWLNRADDDAVMEG